MNTEQIKNHIEENILPYLTDDAGALVFQKMRNGNWNLRILHRLVPGQNDAIIDKVIQGPRRANIGVAPIPPEVPKSKVTHTKPTFTPTAKIEGAKISKIEEPPETVKVEEIEVIKPTPEPVPVEEVDDSNVKEPKLKGTSQTVSGAWKSNLTYKGKFIYLGSYKTALEAHTAYLTGIAVLQGKEGINSPGGLTPETLREIHSTVTKFLDRRGLTSGLVTPKPLSKPRGVRQTAYNSFLARITHQGDALTLGSYSSESEAYLAFWIACNILRSNVSGLDKPRLSSPDAFKAMFEVVANRLSELGYGEQVEQARVKFKIA